MSWDGEEPLPAIRNIGSRKTVLRAIPKAERGERCIGFLHVGFLMRNIPPL
jgi:hypothetical protein